MKKSNPIKHKGRILIIDDEPEVGWIFSKILGDNGYEVMSSQTGKDGLAQVKKNMPDLIFLDLKLPEIDGIHLLNDIKKINPESIVIMITAHETIQTAVAAMKQGAYDYIPKPIPNERLKIIVDKALETQSLSKQVDFLTKTKMDIGEIIGQSKVMQELFRLIRTVASHDISVILKGESGTGKELAARAIHALSSRRNKPFMPIDCATLPDTLVESELFGYEKGAFTGADTFKIGRFEAAEGGTIFLDEIANLTTHIQVKLLRVLQERKIERLGGQKAVKVNARVITATNKDLGEAVRKGEFRDDLYYRLRGFEIMLPPLREREDDLVLLSHHFLNKFNKEMNKDVRGFSDKVLNLFKKYRWPGNVRELEHAVKSSIILAKDIILPCHIPLHITDNTEKGIKNGPTAPAECLNRNGGLNKTSLKEAKKNVTEDAEKYLITKTLDETNWNKKKSSKILGIDYKTLFNKIKKYNIQSRFNPLRGGSLRPCRPAALGGEAARKGSTADEASGIGKDEIKKTMEFIP